MKILQINTGVNLGSVGRRAEDMGCKLIENGHESYIAISSRTNRPSKSNLIVIGNKFDVMLHGIKSRLFDRHGFGSRIPTLKFIEQIKKINPDIIHLRNLHGYYLNIEVLFNYLKEADIPVVWTFHDCWPITGHCSFFDKVNCYKWKTECNNCPNLSGYPSSMGFDNSKQNYYDKKKLFNSVKTMHLIGPCKWMVDFIKESYLSSYNSEVIYNGINTEVFSPNLKNGAELKNKLGIEKFRIILGSANIWDWRKGLQDFVELNKLIDKSNTKIILIGLTEDQIKALPKDMMGIKRTDSIEQLASFYNIADVFVNPTYVDNFPTTNLEALSSGTPIVTYKTGGSPEAIDQETGFAVEKGDIQELFNRVGEILVNGKDSYIDKCRNRGFTRFNRDITVENYYNLYQKLINEKNEQLRQTN